MPSLTHLSWVYRVALGLLAHSTGLAVWRLQSQAWWDWSLRKPSRRMAWWGVDLLRQREARDGEKKATGHGMLWCRRGGSRRWSRWVNRRRELRGRWCWGRASGCVAGGPTPATKTASWSRGEVHQPRPLVGVLGCDTGAASGAVGICAGRVIAGGVAGGGAELDEVKDDRGTADGCGGDVREGSSGG